MGIGIFVPNADFSSLNLGQVTPLQDIPVTAIAIEMNASYSGITFTPSVTYTPANSNKKGVTWSITAGGTYATIDATTGVVTILSTANASNITIQAVSNYDNSIVATASTSVTYKDTVDILTSLSISGSAIVSGITSQYDVSYTPSNTSKLGVTWSITAGGTYATINANTGLLTVLSNATSSPVTVRATSSVDNTIYAEKSITVTYSLPKFNLGNNILMFKTSSVPTKLTLGDASILIAFEGVYGTYRNNGGSSVYNHLLWGLNNKNNTFAHLLFRTNFNGDYTNMFDAGTTYCATKTTGLSTPDTCKYLVFSNKHLYVVAQDNTTYPVDFTSNISSQNFTGDLGNFSNGKFVLNVRAVSDSVLNAIASQSDLNTAITGGTITIGSTLGYLTKFIIIPNSAYTTADDIIANRANAFIDMKFDTNGSPYNAGTGAGEVYFTNN